MPPYVGVAMMILLGLAFAGASIVGAGIIRPKHPTPGKMDAYESGVPPTGDTRGRHHVRFYMVAMLFVVFDVELIFLYPWAVRFAHAEDMAEKVTMFIAMVVFVTLLAVADVVGWKMGVFDWNRE
ncbi:MAG TPA: NADH-quinone oxidoreductase subunit A [Chloroflexota bacterium]|nr:NADH-quinone oxidoreductase subunit A [Chloroflexota bacterium]